MATRQATQIAGAYSRIAARRRRARVRAATFVWFANRVFGTILVLDLLLGNSEGQAVYAIGSVNVAAFLLWVGAHLYRSHIAGQIGGPR